MKRKLTALCLLLTMLAGLCACQETGNEITGIVTSTPAETTSAEDPPSVRTVSVSTVDELLAALDSNVIIELAPGTYHLDQARDFGKDSDNPAYYWEETGDGSQLMLNHLHDLTIRGEDPETTSLEICCKFSNILYFSGCKRITLEGFTAGHSEGVDPCTSSVIFLDGCQEVRFQKMGLFGCGYSGIDAAESADIFLENTDIYDCSGYGIQAYGCSNLYMSGCNFYALGAPDLPAEAAFKLIECKGAMIKNCSITENHVLKLLQLHYSQGITLESSEFRANTIRAYGFEFKDCSPVVKNCSFDGNDLRRWYAGYSEMGENELGELIGDDQLPPVTTASAGDSKEQEIIHVKTANEFLQALGSDRKIILDCALLDLHTATDYGWGSSAFYLWQESFDGPELLIHDVYNLTIEAPGQNKKAHSISAVPRYANVLSFYRCGDLTLRGFTAGHTEAPGECSGGVLYFEDCERIQIDSCGLFGCGILGIRASFCSSLTAENCDIYDCSLGGIELQNVDQAVIRKNSFRDLGGPA